MRKIEAQASRLDQRSGLLDVRAENVSQRGVHQVRRRVIALDVFAARAVGVSRDAVAHGKFFFCDDAVRDQSGNGIIRAAHVGKLHRVLVVPERAGVGDLSAGFGVKHRAIEDDFAFSARRELIHRAVFGDDGLDAAIFRGRAEIKIRFRAIRFRELRVHRIRDVLCARLSRRRARGCAAPPSPVQIPASVEGDAVIAGRIRYEIERQAIGVVKLESLSPCRTLV